MKTFYLSPAELKHWPARLGQTWGLPIAASAAATRHARGAAAAATHAAHYAHDQPEHQKSDGADDQIVDPGRFTCLVLAAGNRGGRRWVLARRHAGRLVLMVLIHTVGDE